ALSHKEVRVRREAVQALGQIGGDRAFSLLAKVLADEDVRVRSMAALNLAKVGKTASQPYLLEIIQSKEFSKKEPSEKKAFMDAMGMIDPKFSLRSLPKMPKGAGPAVPPPTEKAADGVKKGETTLPSPATIKDQIPLAGKGNLRKETRPSLRVISAKRSTPVKPARKGAIGLLFFRWLNPFRKKE
ncbi:MAG: HEAT repeat domain-containing protein, partial [Deltaproteobacteria bacterium]|nr:HEAT repeat domain-containing protein [Deltaproteobacteria bacterium]